uniref:Ribonuclease H-like domain-containing protein n=1 Tax=Tanacetum cinerariifolium TaxID=118510 RepID=A0A6L2L6F0_TANCI|nr:ribonuclease H-like domain-containing protein [Tanacetum cinerariifolium]
MDDAKEMWETIKSRFGCNDESKKMQKYLLKQQFEGFSMSTLEGLHKGYDRFQTLLSQLEIYGAGVSHEDANQKFLSAPQLDYDDLEQINNDHMEEMDLKWQMTMTFMRIKKFYKRTGRKSQFDTEDPVGFDKTKVECFNCHKIRHFARDCRAKGNQDSKRRDVGYNGNKTRDNDAHNYAMMAYSSSNSDSDNESVFMNKASDLEDTSVNDRYAAGMHAVPLP